MQIAGSFDESGTEDASTAAPLETSGSGLRGRRRECDMLDRFVADVRAGQSRELVLRGEAGVGKTALLRYLGEGAPGCRIAKAAGVESEMELAFAGIHQLCSPFMDRLERLPAPQRDSLSTAFGLRVGDAPDRFLVGLAVLNLLSDVADEQSLICVIDDAQWLDRASAQTIAFVARRILAERIGLVCVVREPTDDHELEALSSCVVEGLIESDARLLLESAIPGPMDEAVRDRILAESRGNPLALLELPRGLTPAELAGGFGRPDARPLASRIEQSFLRRLEQLPCNTQRLLLIAAAEPVGDVTLLWRAAATLGIGVDAAGPAQEAGLIEFGTRVRFHHPLVRSAAYRAASPEDRQSIHRALAEVTDPEVDPDRRAWHRAGATLVPDEDVAAELDQSANRAQARGGLAAVAAFRERATELTLDPARRATRALEAALAQHQAGAPDVALGLLASAEAGPLDELQRARGDLLRGHIAFVSRRSNEAPWLLLAAARRLEPLDSALARDTYLDAFSAALIFGRGSRAVVEVATAARAAPEATAPPRASDLMLDGLALLITEGYAAGAPTLRRALTVFNDQEFSIEDELRWLWLAGRVAWILWDHDMWRHLVNRLVQLARQVGAFGELLRALNANVVVHLVAGELSVVASLVEEAAVVRELTGSNFAPYGALGLAAEQGRKDDADELAGVIMKLVVERGEGIGVTVVGWANALICNSLGQYDLALTAAESAYEYPEELGFATWSLLEFIEAAARSGHIDRASVALDRLSEVTRGSGGDWALGVEARSRALLSEGETADLFFREAVERLGRTRVRAELARARLLYGEWLRRENRRLDAREQLRSAHEMFVTMGLNGFADRAARELLATGETVRKRTVDTRDELTPQESQIARLAAEGHTNPEIGAQLFISSRTVEWHLRKVFTKLGISSRKELDRVLSAV